MTSTSLTHKTSAMAASGLCDSKPRFDRLAGLAGLGFLVMVVCENVLRGAPPANDSGAAKIIDYYVHNRGRLALTEALFALSVPLLLIYAAGLYRGLRRTVASEPWAWIGLGGAHLIVASFGLVFALDVTANASISRLAAEPELAQLLYRLHAGAFVLNFVVLGVTLGAFGLAANTSASQPRWLVVIALTGACLLIVAAVPGLAVVEGSPWALLGLGGFICWLAWVAVTSVRMLRSTLEGAHVNS
jgi:hypothetical protein